MRRQLEHLNWILDRFEVRGPSPDFSGALQSAKAAHVEALVVVGNPLILQSTKQIFDLAAKYRLPSMTEEARFVNAGGLISYGASLLIFPPLCRVCRRHHKRCKPGELPIKLASRFEIVINLKTSRQLGLVIPQHVLVQADKVIQ